MTSPLRPWADVAVDLTLEAAIRREPLRARCVRCRQRRVLYRIVIEGKILLDAGVSEARCAECWGVREPHDA
jgi:hypothetical protein